MTVILGEKQSSWGLSRWKGGGRASGACLRFVPPDDEGFALRGDRQRLVYKGRRRSHRFTILGDTAFEYNCILNREPESNVITLLMEGADRFDFFRQPDFVKDPFLKGSYAVYKKETFVGEGTGKLCHIHRPEIIDSRGRRCWGDLSVVGNRLCITIPEEWLSEAKYPVIVDPTIGTTTIGSQTPQNVGSGAKNPWLHYEFGVNRFVMTEKCQGLCTAHVYCYDQVISIGDVTPLIFGDENGKPHYRRTQNEETIDTLLVNPRNITIVYDPQWKTGTFKTIGEIREGEYAWFGCYGEAFWTKFDYGGTLYKNYPEVFVEQEEEEIYNEETGEWEWTEGIYYDLPDFPLNGKEKTQDCIFSWYFDFESLSKNYTRTLTQGVTLTDTRKPVGNYQRNATQTVRGTSTTKGLAGFYRGIVEAVKNTMNLKRFPTLIRRLVQQAGANDGLERLLSILRQTAQTAGAAEETRRITQAKRAIADTGKPGTDISRKQDFRRDITHGGNAETAALRNADYVKRFRETAGSTAHAGVVRDVVLRLIEAVAALYETQAGAGFKRGITDNAAIGSVMGGMVTFFRVLFGHAGSGDSTGSFISRMRVIQDTEAVYDKSQALICMFFVFSCFSRNDRYWAILASCFCTSLP
jgi:hypothetical protein